MKRNNPNDARRICTVCKEDKPISEFGKHACMSDGIRSDCKACGVKAAEEHYKKHPEQKKTNNKRYRDRHKDKVNAMTRKWRKTNPEVTRKHNLKKYFGLSIQDYDDMYIKQGGRCAICGTHQSELSQRLSVDHNHDTNCIRGLLCSSCNLALGGFGDSPDILRNAIKYLEQDN